MSTKEQLVDQHIREYQARLKHIDELMAQADASIRTLPENAEVHAELASLKSEREKLNEHLATLQQEGAAEWAEKGGPMVIWDIIAERLEHLVERVGHRRPH